jgi:hypothetical protein
VIQIPVIAIVGAMEKVEEEEEEDSEYEEYEEEEEEDKDDATNVKGKEDGGKKEATPNSERSFTSETTPVRPPRSKDGDDKH